VVVAGIGSVVDCTLADAAAVVVDVVTDGIRGSLDQTEEPADSRPCSFAFDHVDLDLAVVASSPWVV